MEKKTTTTRKFAMPLMAAAMVAGLGGGGIAVYAQSAAAQSADAATTNTTGTSGTTSTSNTSSSSTIAKIAQVVDKATGGHIGQNGVKETILTGDTAAKVTAAALAAQPGGTIERVETDAEGAVYEAHMTKADGTEVNLKFDTNYNVTATETGHGGHGGHGANDGDGAN